jgi:iron(III) transport system substrate-binding protein
MDEEEKYIFVFNADVQSDFSYNSKLVNPKEFRSLWDFLNPKWKGKMVMYDPTLASGSMQFVYHHPELGPPFLRRLFSEMEIPASRDYRQLGDWLAVGKYALILFTNADRIDLEIAKKQGLPVDSFDPTTFKEGAILGSANGNLALIDRAPHPNSARVAINWLLSRKGQTIYQRILQNNSRRIDIPKDHMPPNKRRKEGVQYVWTDKPEWLDMKPILDFVNESWKIKR